MQIEILSLRRSKSVLQDESVSTKHQLREYRNGLTSDEFDEHFRLVEHHDTILHNDSFLTTNYEIVTNPVIQQMRTRDNTNSFETNMQLIETFFNSASIFLAGNNSKLYGNSFNIYHSKEEAIIRTDILHPNNLNSRMLTTVAELVRGVPSRQLAKCFITNLPENEMIKIAFELTTHSRRTRELTVNRMQELSEWTSNAYFDVHQQQIEVDMSSLVTPKLLDVD